MARDLGERKTLNKWVNDYQRAHLGRSRSLTSGPALGVPGSREEELEAEVRRLRLENEFLKSRGLLRQDIAVAVRCALIEAEKDTYPVTWMCSQLAALFVLRLSRPRGDPGRHATPRQTFGCS